MYLVLKNVRLNHVTYEKGSLVDEIPDSRYKHCFKKADEKKEVKRGKVKAETATIEPKTENR